jgi:hypothetical protein
MEQHLELGLMASPIGLSSFHAPIALIFSTCIVNTITHFISLQMEAIKLQLLVTQYRPLGQEEPDRIPGTDWACPQVGTALKGGNEQEDCLKAGMGHEKLLVKP